MRVTDSANLILLSVSIVLAALAAIMTPEVFIDLGPLRRSLTSEIDMVRKTALLEVAVFRAGCGIAALFTLTIVFYRKRAINNFCFRKTYFFNPFSIGRSI